MSSKVWSGLLAGLALLAGCRSERAVFWVPTAPPVAVLETAPETRPHGPIAEPRGVRRAQRPASQGQRAPANGRPPQTRARVRVRLVAALVRATTKPAAERRVAKPTGPNDGGLLLFALELLALSALGVVLGLVIGGWLGVGVALLLSLPLLVAVLMLGLYALLGYGQR